MKIWKRGLSLLLVLLLLCTLSVTAFGADTDEKAVQTMKALGIMVGDQTGNMNLSDNVTRAQFAKMVVAASSYRDTVSSDGSGYSLYKDVKSSYWASEYIRVMVEQGWMVGYTDGTFRPDNAVTLEQACTVALRLLGYDESSLAGSFPTAQLSKAGALGLRNQISAQRGQAMTRLDCARLFYNLMTAKTSSNQTYAVTLGYTLTNGEVDYTSVTKNNLKGPYISDGSTQLPFTPLAVYRNGKTASSTVMNINDVYYYNEGMQALWIYTTRASGKITALSPSSTAPTSVTVSGKTYTIGSADATYQLSVFSGVTKDQYVTLLLGMDDAVVGILSGSAVNTMYYGVVQNSSKIADDNIAAVQTQVTVFCTDGVTRTFTVEKDTSYTVGKLVSANVTQNGVQINVLSEKGLSGTVNKSGSGINNYSFSAGIEVLDTSKDGAAVQVDAKRLAGCYLSSSQVRYYTLNSSNEIDCLILNNVTGDTWTYGYMTNIDDASESWNINVSYTYLVNGQMTTLRSSGTKYAVDVGGFAICYKADGSVSSMRQLSSVRLTELYTGYAVYINQKYTLSDEVQVYLRKNDTFYQTSLSAINAEDYSLTGWYDNFGCSAGGQIRVIIAIQQ